MLIYALDDLNQIGQITGWSALSAKERDLDVGTWSIEVPLDGADASVIDEWLDPDVHAGIEVFDPVTGWRYGGPAIVREYEITPAGAVARLQGVDHMCHLARRVYHYDPLDPSLEYIYLPIGLAGKVTSLLHAMAASELLYTGPSDPLAYRKMPELSGVWNDDQGSFVGEGDIVNYKVNGGTTLLEITRAVLAGKAWTCRMRLHRNPNAGGSIQFSTPPRENANTRLSIANGGYGSAKVRRTLAPSTMTIAVGGVPDYDDPEVDPRQTSWARRLSTQTGYWLYGEQYLDFGNLFDQELQTEFFAAHTEAQATESLTVEGAEVEGWGRDVDLGWYVAAEVGVGGRTRVVDLPVAAYELSGAPGELRQTISVGAFEAEGAALMVEMIRSVSQRVGRLERSA